MDVTGLDDIEKRKALALPDLGVAGVLGTGFGIGENGSAHAGFCTRRAI